MLRVQYEQLITAPAETVRQICDFFELPFEDGMLDLGSDSKGGAWSVGMGDPNANRRADVDPASPSKWMSEVTDDDSKRFLRRVRERLRDDDVRVWGYDPAELDEQLATLGIG